MKALQDAKVIAERLIERGPLDEVAIVAGQFLRVSRTPPSSPTSTPMAR